jgi:hypothetical protein
MVAISAAKTPEEDSQKYWFSHGILCKNVRMRVFENDPPIGVIAKKRIYKKKGDICRVSVHFRTTAVAMPIF